MGPQAAINAVFYNQLQAIEDEDERAASAPRSCAASTPRTSTSCTSRPSWSSTRSIQPEDLRAELVKRFAVLRRQAPRVAGEAQPGHAGLRRP